MSQNQQGQIKQQDYANNTGGLNLADSVFKITETHAAGGMNFDYVLTGGIRKRFGSPKINAVPDSSLYSLGFGLYAPASGLVKNVIRAAGRVLELVDTSTPSFTVLTDDTVSAGSTPFASGTKQDVQFQQFNTGTSNVLWAAGGGAALPVGVYATNKFTVNGVPAPTGAFSGVVNAHNGGSWTAFGQYFYAFAWRKRSTQDLSNASKDFTVTTLHLDDTVTITLTPPADVTLYDQVWVYRSALDGTNIDLTGFTTGNLVAQLPITTTTFVDKGDLGNPDFLLVQTIPRVANLILDNSTLPAGSYKTITLWSNRLVTSSGNVLHISDVNKAEAWPLTNRITIPSAGDITALATISFTSPQANTLQELLVVFKERELWCVTPGANSDYTTWVLMKIDNNVGCPQQSLVVTSQGFLTWIDFRGVWIWDGSSKPIYASRLIETLFGTAGDLDKAKFNEGCGVFFRRENQIVWYLSSKTFGEQTFCIKMDIRLTSMQIQQNLTGRTIDGVLMQDVHAFPIYAAMPYIPLGGNAEKLIQGDSSGFCYFGSDGTSDGGADYSFKYLTAPLHCGNPNINKQFNSVIVWVEDAASWDLTLDYWVNYQSVGLPASSQSLPINTSGGGAGSSLWDIALWDVSFWDAFTPNVTPLVFNLQAGNNNGSQGTAIQLQFRNDKADQPIVIHGFSLLYSELGGLAP